MKSFFFLLIKWFISHLVDIAKWSLSMLGGFLVIIKPTFPFILICIVFVICDCISAYRLAQRVKKMTGKATAKVRSDKLSKAFKTGVLAMVAVVLAFVIEKFILVMHSDLYLANYTALVFCGIQFWSITENESSCNGSKWAAIAQKFMVDKTERHLDIDLSILKDKEEEK
jgi:hypothetical protein